jgi:hypothetical protein
MDQTLSPRNLCHSATLQCNVDRLDGGGLTDENHLLHPPLRTSPIKEVIPWIFIYAANAS